MSASVNALIRRLADTPKEFTSDETALVAVAGDVLLRTGALDSAWLSDLDAYTVNERALALLACWVVSDESLLAASPDAFGGVKRLLGDTVPALAQVVRASSVTADPDRREELARLAMRDLGVAPEGENPAEAVDRLATVDSVRRVEVLRAAQAAEQRAAAVRKAMAEKRAQEAAARYTQV